ncbi:LysR family transcriptional regulator [Duganella sp. CT11-25]|uniref:LysR family transcriptional regulator n=1 Tax=unclassified Duganella TaxID=2636909 RepID=UPI0039AFA43B
MDRITAAQVFVSIAERGSMIAAADALDMSRAMVTRYLAEMEQWAGARLLHRSTRRLSLTDAGDVTLARCRAMLALAGTMEVAADDPGTPQGLLRITSSQSLAQAHLAGAVTAYLARYPRISVDLQMNNRAVNLIEERIDLALRITNALEPNLIARQLGLCDSVVCAAPSYLAARGTPQRPEDLASHNCLTYTYFGKSLWQFTRAGGEAVSVPVGGNLSANEDLVLLKAAEQGAGIALQPLYSAAPLIAEGRLVALLPDCAPQRMGIYGIYTSRQHMSPGLRTMLDFLVDWFGNTSLKALKI